MVPLLAQRARVPPVRLPRESGDQMISGLKLQPSAIVLGVALALCLTGCGSGHANTSTTVSPSSSASSTSTSTLHKRVRIPIVLDYSVHLAIQAIENRGLRFAKQKSIPNHQQPQGTVTATSPPGGNVVAADSAVTLYVSSGPAICAHCAAEPRMMPDVCGLDFQQANTALVKKGITVNQRPIRQASSKHAGTVIGTQPAVEASFIAYGSSAAKAVTVIVSSGHTTSPRARSQASC